MMRINRYLAECGVGSRRACDRLVEEGRVKINGKTAQLGQEVDETRDAVTLEGKTVRPKALHSYYMMNKPKGYVCTAHDDKGRKTVMDLLPEDCGRVFSVGRLDYDSEGLLLFTDDGDLAFRLTHPKNEIPKTYSVRIEGRADEKILARIRSGVELDGKRTKKCALRVTEETKEYTRMVITVTEGRNREIRRMFEEFGKTVVYLKRIRIGELSVGSLERGKVRRLTAEEIYYLQNL